MPATKSKMLKVLLVVALGHGLSPNQMTCRRQALKIGLGSLVTVPTIALAKDTDAVESTGVGADRNTPIGMDDEYQPQQRGVKGKLDLNAATVNEYMQFPGMYPKVAGKIASNGPYKNTQDIYKVLSASEKSIFKKYEQYFVVVYPPGRMFNERVNQRQSL